MAKELHAGTAMYKLRNATDALVSGDFDTLAGIGSTLASGTQASNIADATAATVTYTTNEITGNGSVTIADGSSPTNDEILEFAEELATVQATLVTKLNAVIAALEAFGITASS